MKVMNRSATVLILCEICYLGPAQSLAGAGDGNPASAASGYTITLTQPKNPFHLDSPIQVTMTIKNITQKDILWRAGRSTDIDAWYHDFQFLFQNNGKEVETTFFHRKISNRQRPDDPVDVWSGSTILLPKPPGTMFVMTIDLKHLYQITEPGQYMLEVSHLAEDDRTVVRSNAVTLSIVP